jgi:hypothetical protein
VPAFGDRILKLARTLADLAGSDRTPSLRRTQCGASVQTAHIAEAIHLRSAATAGVTRGTRLAYVAWKDEMRQPRQGWYLQNAA